MNRKIIIALIIIFLIILGGIITFSQSTTKVDTQITFLSNTTLQSGDSVEFQLTDAQGNALENQNLTISFGTSRGLENYSVITDSEGKGSLVLNDESDGNYTIAVSYAGDDKHNGCSNRQMITIGDGTVDYSTTQTAQSSDSSSDLNYDSDTNSYYDSNGQIVGGQNDGADYNYIKDNQPNVVNGSLE